MNEQASPEIQQQFCNGLRNLINQAGKDAIPLGLVVSEIETVKTYLLFNEYSRSQMLAMQAEMEKNKAEATKAAADEAGLTPVNN